MERRSVAILVSLALLLSLSPGVAARPTGSSGEPTTWNQIVDAVGGAASQAGQAVMDTAKRIGQAVGNGVTWVSHVIHQRIQITEQQILDTLGVPPKAVDFLKWFFKDPIGAIFAVIGYWISTMVAAFFGVIVGTVWGFMEVLWTTAELIMMHLGNEVVTAMNWIFNPILSLYHGSLHYFATGGAGPLAPVGALSVVVLTLLVVALFLLSLLRLAGMVA